MTPNTIKLFSLIAVIVNLADGITAMMIGSAEANIVYMHSPILFIIFKILYSVFFIWMGFYASNDGRIKKYISVCCLVYAIPLFTFGFITNVQALMNPVLIEIGSQYTVSQKTSFYTSLVLIPGILLMIKDMLVFKLYDHWLKCDGDVK